ncbi:MAG: SDR family oxidoreductase [Bacteroidota bacterium]
MELGLKDKVVIVTGGDKGIGKAIVEELAAEGAIPVILGRTEVDVVNVFEEIKQTGAKVHYRLVELTDNEQCQKAIDEIKTTLGHIDGLVNNAGVNDQIGLEQGTYDDFIKSIKRNVGHYYQMARLCLPELKKNKGAIVNIGSKVSVTGQGGTSGYAAANGARDALTREWAVELLPYGIRVNAVIVAESYTSLYEKWIGTFDNPTEKLKSIQDKIPFDNRMTTTKEIADTVLFLLSNRASHTTGQLLFVDGGYTHLDRAIT